MKVSVIIPTYNGAHKLPGILNALEKQTHQPDEIIVVVDGSTDNTKEILTEYESRMPALKTFYQSNKGRAAVRNAGASKATGELLVFFDDDMRPEPVCLEVHVQHHNEKQDSILTGAQVDIRGKELSDIQNYKAYISDRWAQPLIKNGDQPLSKKKIFITAANFSISKELFVQLGGFDENLTDAEDFDLAARAFEKGIELYYDHNAFAWHNDYITGKIMIARQRQYRKAHERLYELKPGLFRQFSLPPPQNPVGFKKHFFLFFAKRFWVNWLDKNIFKNFIPRKWRYKIYDWIITSNGVYFPEKTELKL